jgi:hypothetical protein
VCHRDDPVLELVRREPGDQVPERLAVAEPLPGLGVGEVEVFDRDRSSAGGLRMLEDGGDRGAEPPVTGAGRGSHQVELDTHGPPDRVSGRVETGDGEVVGVQVDPGNATGPCRSQVDGLDGWAHPRRAQVRADSIFRVGGRVDVQPDGEPLIEAFFELEASVVKRDWVP